MPLTTAHTQARRHSQRKFKNINRWRKLTERFNAQNERNEFLCRVQEIYAERRYNMVVCRNMMVAGRAEVRNDIMVGAKNAKNILVKGVLKLHPDHKDNVAMNLLFSRRMPNRAFTKITRFLLHSHTAYERDVMKVMHSSIEIDELNKAKKKLKTLRGLWC